MAQLLLSSIRRSLRRSINSGLIGGPASAVVLVLKNLITQGSDQLITQSGDTFVGNVR